MFFCSLEGVNVSPIVQMESVASTGTALSQFFSLDSSGNIVFWITASADATVGIDLNKKSSIDYGISPWSTVKLVSSRVIKSSSRISWQSILPNTVSPKAVSIPGDSSTLLLAAPTGVLKKIARFGNPASPVSLGTFDFDSIEIAYRQTANPTRENSSAAGKKFYF